MEKRSLISGYYLIEQDLKEILTFVEPVNENYTTYSHRLYALLVRACTEFEANCKSILIENGKKLGDKSNMNTYYDIHDYVRYRLVNEYPIILQASKKIDLMPLKDWQKNKSPSWYQEYNDVKHSRILNFDKANLENVLNAVAAIFILLYSRYEKSAFGQYQEVEFVHEDDDGYLWKETSLFKIKRHKNQTDL